MNTMLDLIKSRRSVRKYQTRQVSAEELQTVLEAGTFAPSGGGKQPAVIVAVQDKEVIAKLSRMNAAIMGKEMDPYYGAPTVVLVLADGGRPTYVEDGSCVLMNMMLAAHAQGLGSCWIHREKEMFNSEEGRAMLKEWGVPDGMIGVGSLALGYPEGDQAAAAPRKENFIFTV